MSRNLKHYLLAFAIIFFGIFIHFTIPTAITTEAPYLFVYLSVVFISVMLGLGPGVSAAILGVIGMEFLQLEPRFAITFDIALVIRGTVIIISAAFLGYIGDRLRTSESRVKVILNSIPDMAWLKDKEGRLILVNDAYAMSCGTNAVKLSGKTDFDVWPPELAAKYRADDEEVMKRRSSIRVEERLVLPNGSLRWVETIKTPIFNDEDAVIGSAGIARDITNRKRMQEEIRHMAQHDPLTGLANRRLFQEVALVELAEVRRRGGKLAIFFLDLDGFKKINDTFGHEVGDRLLKEAALRIKSAVRNSDTVARIGGDEFNVIVSDMEQAEYATEIAVKIMKEIRKPFAVDGHELHTSASIGISIYPDDGRELETLLRYSDIAMYYAKSRGRNRFQFYNPVINTSSLERIHFENNLRRAIDRDELRLYFQPLIDVVTGKMISAEVLVRWQHPEQGLLLPGRFFKTAEDIGLLPDIDIWVLKTACAQIKTWLDQGLYPVRIAVNLSSKQIQSSDLIDGIRRVLEETGLPPQCLGIEITETAAMGNGEYTIERLRRLSSLGIPISIDDFGTGYSSLSYLKKLPVSRLKIDQSFIRDIAIDKDDRAIISAVVSMAREMGIKTVAEGVETEEQFRFVKEAGCDEAQGFLVSEPLPPERFRDMVAPGT